MRRRPLRLVRQNVRALVDTSALLALSNARDQHHTRAVTAARAHREAGGRYLSTLAVLTEFHARLMYLRGPRAAHEAITRLLADPVHEWVAVSPDIAHHAVTGWLARFNDQGISLTDAISFEIMRRERVTHAFAFDRHFELAGFKLLAE
jgi:predicted nucleic acid-binding protein